MPTLPLAIDARRMKSGAAEADAALNKVQKSADKSGKAMGRFDDKTAKAGKTAKLVKRAFIGLFAGITATIAVRAAIGVFKQYEETMLTVKGVTGATAEGFAELSESARRLGATTRFSANEAAEGLLFLARAGFDTDESVAALPDVLNLATAGALALGSAADIASNVLSQFNLQATQTGIVGDILVATSNRANTSVSQMAEALVQVGPIAGALNFSLESTSAAIGTLGDSGIQGGQAGTNLRGVLASLLSPTDAAKASIKGLGLEVSDLDPATNSLSDIIHSLADANMTAADAVAIFGRRNAAAALILAASADNVDRLTEANHNAAGEAKALADIIATSLTGRLKSMMSAVQELAISALDTQLGTALKNSIVLITNVLLVFAGMEEHIDGNAKAAKILATSIKVLTVAAVTYAVITKGAAVATLAWSAAVAVLNAVLAANPVGLIIMGLASVIALLVILRNKTFMIDERVVSLSSLVQATIEVGWDLLKRFTIGAMELNRQLYEDVRLVVKLVISGLSQTLFGPAIQLLSHFGITWSKAWEGMKRVTVAAALFVISIFTSTEDRAMAILNRLIEATQDMVEGFKQLSSLNFQAAKTAFGSAATWLDPANILREQIGITLAETRSNAELLTTILGDPKGAWSAYTSLVVQEMKKDSLMLAGVMEAIMTGEVVERILARAAEIQAELTKAGEAGDGVFSRWKTTLISVLNAAREINLADIQNQVDAVPDAQDEASEAMVRRKEALANIRSDVGDLNFERGLLSVEDRLADKIRILRDARTELTEAGVSTISQLPQLGRLGLAVDLFNQDEDRLAAIEDAADRVGQAFSRNFTDAVTGAKSLNDALKDLGQSILQLIIQQTIANPVADSISGALQGSGLFGAVFGGATASAQGNVFNAGSVVPFASGGIVSSPTLFPMAQGNTGLMGEAGPEAIVPLRRTESGDLGIQGGGGQVINLTFPNSDADSFRRSMPQTMEAARSLGRRIKRGQV